MCAKFNRGARGHTHLSTSSLGSMSLYMSRLPDRSAHPFCERHELDCLYTGCACVTLFFHTKQHSRTYHRCLYPPLGP